MPPASKMWSSSCFSSSASAYWKPEQPPPRTPTRRPTPSPALWPSMNSRTLAAAMSVMMTMPRLYRRFARYSGDSMPSSSELKQRIEEAIPGAAVAVQDLTGGGDHFRAEVVSDRFSGLSRIQQHKLIYDVFGDEVGGPIHALSIKTSTPGDGR